MSCMRPSHNDRLTVTLLARRSLRRHMYQANKKMKRKREHKNKKAKKRLVEGTNSGEVIVGSTIDDNNNSEDTSGSGTSSFEDEHDINDNDNTYSHDDDDDGKADVEAPTVEFKPETPLPPPLREPEKVIQRPPPMAVYGRVRVKLKAATKPSPSAPVETPMPTVPLPEPQPEPILVEDKGGDGEGVSIESEADKSEEEDQVDKKDESNDGSGNGEKVVEESGHSGSAESKKSGGMGIKIVSLKSSSLSSSSYVVDNKETGGSRVSPEAKKEEEGRVDKKEGSDGGGESGEKVVEESENLGSAESKKSGGMGIKIVSSKTSSLSPPGMNAKDSGGSRVSSPEAKKEEEDRVDKKEESNGGGETGEMVVEESGNSESAESKKSGGTGIKIVASKSLSLSPPGVNAKDSGESRVLPEAKKDEEERVDKEESNHGGGNGEKVVEESGNLGLAETKKSGGMGIKIVSSKTSSLGSSPPGVNAKESGGSRVSPEAKTLEAEEVELEDKKQKAKSFNRWELEASLEVINKVMKMDAAEPFNVPVNPIELGIPDYFDIIDTPMDFGTIRNNLESGAKYMDSEDVYKDAQYIWDNCFKYNNKGDYIVDLMKRVKKNFLKLWMSAGLYTEQAKMSDGEVTAANEATTSGLGKKLKKGKGYKLHKEDCMCAICIMRRRRREREAREAQEAREAGIILPSPQIRVSQTSMGKEHKQEVHLHAESPGEYTSSYMENSPDGDAEMEDGETRQGGFPSQYFNQLKAGDGRIELHDKSDRSGDISEKSLRNVKGEIDLYSHDGANLQGRMTNGAQIQPSSHLEEPTSGFLHQRNELQELEKKRQRLRLIETFRDLENPMLSGLCGTLFPNNMKSVWNGANSLSRCQTSRHQKSGIHEALASFLTPPSKSASSLK